MLNIFDIIIVLFILLFAIIGFKNGIIKEGVSFIGTILVFVISYSFKGTIGNVLCKFLPFFTFSGKLQGLVSLNILIYQLVGFLLLFSILFGIYHIIFFASKIIQKVLNATIILIIPSKIGGAVIGLIKGYLIAFTALLILIVPLSTNDLFKNSKLTNYILYDTPVLSHDIKDLTLTMLEVKDIIVQIEEGTTDVDNANIHIIETMIKLKTIDAHTVEQLIVLDKLNTVKGINEMIEKYK